MTPTQASAGIGRCATNISFTSQETNPLRSLAGCTTFTTCQLQRCVCLGAVGATDPATCLNAVVGAASCASASTCQAAFLNCVKTGYDSVRVGANLTSPCYGVATELHLQQLLVASSSTTFETSTVERGCALDSCTLAASLGVAATCDPATIVCTASVFTANTGTSSSGGATSTGTGTATGTGTGSAPTPSGYPTFAPLAETSASAERHDLVLVAAAVLLVGWSW